MTVDTQAPPLDLATFRARAHRILSARDQARSEYEKQGLLEADAEHEYRKNKAAAFAIYRAEAKGVTEAELLAEGDVASHRRARDRAHVLAKSSLLRVDELERNASMLRAEFAATGELG